MSDAPTFDELDGQPDPVGDSVTRKVQSLGRVDIPDEYLHQLDVDEGENVFVVCDENEVRIIKASAENLVTNGR